MKQAQVAVAVISGMVIASAPAVAATIESALAYAYQNNPLLNSQRANVRATDEGIPQALAGYRPKASIIASVGVQSNSTTLREIGSLRSRTDPKTGTRYFTNSGYNVPRGVGVAVTQTLLDGFQTANRTRLAESQVRAAREALRGTEQTVLLNAATAYMNLLRDIAILKLQRNNVAVLRELLHQTRVRFESRTVTATDVAQAESRVEVGRTQSYAAEANYQSSRAVYRQVIGLEPEKLSPATAVDRFAPRKLALAVSSGTAQHPIVSAAQYNVDVAMLRVRISESTLYPTVSVEASAQKSYETEFTALDNFSAGVAAKFSVPIYQGGAEYATIRQAKEMQGQKQLELYFARDQARAAVIQAWADFDAANSSIESSKGQVKAAVAALNGVREEARLGQRTTLDVLNAQQELVNARVALLSSQRDRVVSSYALLAAVGRLSPEILRLPVAAYDARIHYHQVRDAWAGIRTPDGR